MERRLLPGIVFILGNPKDPGKAEELNDWVVRVHYPEVLAPGIVVRATRFENPQARGDAGSPRFLTIYQTHRADADAAWTEHTGHNARLREQGRITPVHPQSATTMLGVFRRIGDPSESAEDRATKGILAVLFDCDGPDREQWYDEVHIPEALAAGPYHTVTRYENTGLNPGQPTLLTIYQTDWDDPVAAMQALAGPLERLHQRDRLHQRGTADDARIDVKLCLPFKETASRVK